MQLIQVTSPQPAARHTGSRADDVEVTKAVRRHAHAIGCDSSNTQAAIAWALRSPGHTLQAVREGRRRAEQLRGRQAAVPA